MPSDSVDRLAQRTIRDLRGLSSFQRDDFIERVLQSDPELARGLPEVLRAYGTVKQRVRVVRGLLRDSVS